ncbi:MAG: hypothetical protein LBK23_09290 [Oscillospiraceae bacterium]|jgi:hypothetical protein|nr:hypothetical protein [Oscillospiraceae bacterium]
MKQLGNLAVVCAQRRDALLQVSDGDATVFVGYGPNRTVLQAKWRDNETILKIIYELNHGKYADRKEAL